MDEYGRSMPDPLRRDMEVAILHHSMALALLSGMDSKRAYRYLKTLRSYGERNAFVIYSAHRYFYEYLGHVPLAYKYLNRMYNLFNRNPDRPENIAWKGCREVVYLLCLGRTSGSPEPAMADCEVPLKNSGGTQEASEMTLLVNAHVLSYAALMGLKEPEEIAETVLKRVKMGMERNYDHITLRILRAFVPILHYLGHTSLAKGLIRSSIYTAKTERNRYMYEWFRLYEMAVERRPENLERRIRIYESRKYVAHEILARVVAFRLGVGERDNGRIAHEKALRYGGLCYERAAKLLMEKKGV